MEIVRIPIERVRVIIGEEGNTKKLIEEKCKIKLNVDSDGEVEIDGDSAEIFFAKDVVKAIGRGFEPRDALRIVDDNYQFELIDLKDELKNEKTITRVKGRVIGEKGKMKTEIQTATESVISVYGYTIGVISQIDTMEFALEAIRRIINGSELTKIYDYLAVSKREILKNRLTE
jgi:ribosomal RNA assembly protein